MRRTVTIVVLGMLLAGCGDARPGGPATTPPPTALLPSPSSVAASPTEPAGVPRALPVYYVADTPAGFRLYREFHRVTTADPASDAVREMFGDALDPDYGTYWPSGTALRAPVSAADGVITVDLSGVDGGQVGTELAAMSVQQLVFTVQGALQSTDPVRILVGGAPVGELWGAVDTSRPVARGDSYAVRSLVQIDSPAEGASVGRDVVVSGEAAVFEATLGWEVRRDGVVVRSGFAMTAEGQRFAPFEFTVALDPGTYELRVIEDDPSGGEGRPPLTDTKTIRVSA